MLLNVDNNLLGSTDINVKQYFDISAYRNVLDMLNTFEGVLNRLGKNLSIISNNSVSNNRLKKSIMTNPVITGYSIKAYGKNAGLDTSYKLVNKLLKQAKLKSYSLLPGTAFVPATKFKNLSSNFSLNDLMDLGRNINWELNRLRLPIPANFRQALDKLQAGKYNFILNKNPDPYNYRSAVNGKYFINYIQAINAYKQFKSAINALRIATRKEIDAANLSAKVQEETLRLEQAEILKRDAIQKEAEARRIQILEEKKLAYEKELADAEQLKIDLAATRLELQNELDNLNQLKTVATESELVELQTKENDINNTILQVDNVINDKSKSQSTAIKAAENLNVEIVEVVKQAKKEKLLVEQPGIIKPKKSGLTPILLTIAAGVLLT